MNYRRKLKQYAVYWAPAASNDAGQDVYSAPVEIRCRWEDNVEEKIDAAGQVWMTKTQVFHLERTKEGGFLWLGRLADVTSEDDPTLNADAGKIRMVDGVPSRTADQTLRCSYL